MDKQVDARGLNCPLPVIQTKKALEAIDKGKVTTIVDNEVAKENITKLAKSQNLPVDIKESQGNYYIEIYKDFNIGEIPNIDIVCDDSPKTDTSILITSQKFGEGAEELGKILMKGYIYTLTEIKPYPKHLIFLNSGVYLTVEGSPVLENLKVLEANGVEILSCGTCLDYYKVKDALMVGGISNMYTIAEKLNATKKTIKL